jgi:hypothetical protein
MKVRLYLYIVSWPSPAGSHGDDTLDVFLQHQPLFDQALRGLASLEVAYRRSPSGSPRPAAP